jgi:hypothetical protein
MEAAMLAAHYPRLWHMAEDNSWPSIRQHGLLSTSSLLDLYKIDETVRANIERHHRSESVVIESKGLKPAVIRDQKPMSDAALRKCLKDNLTPKQWYRTLNSMIFFWLTTDRLIRLLQAKPYRNLAHTVLTVSTASLLKGYEKDVRLSPMNSGCTKPYPWPRGLDTFLPITQYPFEEWSSKRKKEPVVEFAVLGGIPDISDHTIAVHRMRGEDILAEIYRQAGTATSDGPRQRAIGAR